MKKFLSCLLVVILLVSLVISLVACDADEIKKLTYTDDNGNVVKVNVKKTDDPDKVTAAIMGLANKEVDRSEISNFFLSLNGNLVISGTEGEEKFDYDATAKAKIGIGAPAIASSDNLASYLAKMRLYALVEANGTVPALMFDDDVETFTEKTTYNELVGLSFEDSTIYIKLGLSDELSSILALLDFILPVKVSDYNNKVVKSELGAFALSGIGSIVGKAIGTRDVLGEIKSAKKGTSYMDIINLLTKEDEEETTPADSTETPDDSQTTEEEEEFTFTYSNVKKIVKALKIKIVKTKGSVVTFTATVDKAGLSTLDFLDEDDKEDLESFAGSFNINFTIDAKTMLDINLSVDASSALKASLQEEYKEKTNLSFSTVKATISLTGSTKDSIPKFTQEDKDAAEELDIYGIVTSMLNKSK